MTCRYVAIDALPDIVLLEIFDFYWASDTLSMGMGQTDAWWRRIVFASPRRLHLELLSTQRAPVGKNLGYWLLTHPIIVDHLINSYYSSNVVSNDEDDIATAL